MKYRKYPDGEVIDEEGFAEADASQPYRDEYVEVELSDELSIEEAIDTLAEMEA